MRFINYRSKVVEKGIHSKRMSKKEDIFEKKEVWEGFRESLTEEDKEWDTMKLEGEEY